MKIVLITQVIYPSLLPRAHRTTELAKELARQGHEVVVYAILGKYDYSCFCRDTGVVVKNLGASSWGLIDSDEKANRNVFVRAFNRLVGRYLWLPDRELIPMVKKAINSEGKVDCLITIAMPHVIHYAASLANLDNVGTWIADCGDPFMLNPLTKQPRYFEKYERSWCDKCDYITIPVSEAVDGYYPEYKSKIRIIPQGFDFSSTKIADYNKNEVPTFAYIGAVYPGSRDPKLFLEYLNTLNIDFKFKIFGSSWSYFEPYKASLQEKLGYCGRMPREKMIYELSKCDFLINIKNDSSVQVPSKLIDYYLSSRPILSISSNFNESERGAFDEFLVGNYQKQTYIPSIQNYNIKNVTLQFISLIK